MRHSRDTRILPFHRNDCFSYPTKNKVNKKLGTRQEWSLFFVQKCLKGLIGICDAWLDQTHIYLVKGRVDLGRTTSSNSLLTPITGCCQAVKNPTRSWQRGSPWYVQSKSHTSITFLSLSVVSYVCQSMKLIFLQTLGGRSCSNLYLGLYLYCGTLSVVNSPCVRSTCALRAGVLDFE